MAAPSRVKHSEDPNHCAMSPVKASSSATSRSFVVRASKEMINVLEVSVSMKTSDIAPRRRGWVMHGGRVWDWASIDGTYRTNNNHMVVVVRVGNYPPL